MQLVERDATLEVLDDAVARAITGRGTLCFVAGEAGIGKSTLAQAVVQRHPEATSLVGACDNLVTPTPLGPLHDMAAHDRQVAALFNLATRHELFVGFLDHLRTPGRPRVVVLEDVHWADAATLDLLRYLGRRIGRSHALVLATYRSDEVGAAHPLRAVLGDLASQPAVTRRTLDPLSLDAVGALAAGFDVDVAELHARTGGNPFFVTEVLAHPLQELPDSLRDAVLARAGRLPDGARRVLDAAALVPNGAERDLLDAVVQPAPGDVDGCVAAGMLRPVAGGVLRFRHELARRALADAILPARAAALHRRIMRTLLAAEPVAPARVVHHADAAGESDVVLQWAVVAAEQATARGAHREATDQLARALRHAGGLDPADRADLLEHFARTCASSDGSGRGLDEVDRAVATRRQLGDPHRLGEALRLQAILQYQSGRSPEAYASIDASLATLRPLGASPELADALADAVGMAMLARRSEQALSLGPEAIDLAAQLGRPRALAAALNSLGSVELLGGRVEDGVERLLRSIEVATDAGHDAEAARGLVNLGSGAGEIRQYVVAREHLTRAIEYAGARDLDGLADYAAVWLGRVHFETGRWDDAVEVLTRLPLEAPDVSAITRITGLATLGRLRTRRGDDGRDALERAWSLARATDDLQRMWPVAAGRAEAALLTGDSELVVELVRPVFDLACRLAHPWATGELGALLWRAGALSDDEHRRFAHAAAAPYRQQVAGQVATAAQAWAAIGCPYEQADVLSDGDETSQREALAILDRLGAVPAAAMLRRRMRAAGVRSVPRGPRAATAQHPAGLTPREAEVLDLVADGLTNAQIGAALFISAKTAGHHVSSILAKLGASDRHEAARMVRG